MLNSSAVDAPTILRTRPIVIEVGVRWISANVEPGVDSPVFAAFTAVLILKVISLSHSDSSAHIDMR